MSFVALIVEDKDFDATLLSRHLRNIADKIFIANDLVTALKIVNEQAIGELHIVTLDLYMPNSTMSDVLNSIKPIHIRHPNCAVVVLTADDSLTARQQVELTEADAFAMKHDIVTAPLLLKIILTAVTKRIKGKSTIMHRFDELIQKLSSFIESK